MRTLLLTLTTCLLVLPVQAKYSGGSGTAKDPYQIATAADLIVLGETPTDYDKHFMLTADIDLDPNLPGRKVFDKATIAPYTVTAKGLQGTPFTGVFDGNAHTISHLTINGAGYYLGLFGALGSGGEAKNLGVIDVNITGSDGYVGGLAGRNEGGAVTRCYCTGAVSGAGQYSCVGGLLGYNYGGHVTQCYSTATVSDTGQYPRVGGLVGDNLGTIIQCYSAGAVRATGGEVGGLTGAYHSCYPGDACRRRAVIASFWDIQISGQTKSVGGTGLPTVQMQDIQTYLNAGWDFVTQVTDGASEVWQMPQGGGYPVLAVFQGYTPPRLPGLGTPDDPYLISDALGLAAIVYHSPYAHYCLTASIDLSGIRWGAAVIPWFAGGFDGDGHTISHLIIHGGDYLGLFGELAYDGEVKNLGVVDVNITGSGTCVGALAGLNDGLLRQCHSVGAVDGKDSVGGLVGYNDEGTVTQCYSTGTVSGSYTVGGLVGNSAGTVTQCYSAGAVNGKGGVGGLVGLTGCTILSHCYSTAAVRGESSVGGLVGYCRGGPFGEITNTLLYHCYSAGAVSGMSDVGGLVGLDDLEPDLNISAVTGCFWDTQTSKQITSAGGTGLTTAEMQIGATFFAWSICEGEGVWTIDEGKDYPRLSWEKKPGRLLAVKLPDFFTGEGTEAAPYLIHTPEQLSTVGFAECAQDKHFKLMADIDLSGKTWSGPVIPRFAGVFDGNGHTISHLTIMGESYVGLFGQLAAGAEVKDLGVVDVNVAGSDLWVGGLVGENEGLVTRCYSTGAVKGGVVWNVGGLVGVNHGTVTQSYSSSGVSGGSSSVGGLVGSNRGTVTQCYSTGAISSKGAPGGLVGWNAGTVTQCYSTGGVNKGSSFSAGGLVWGGSSKNVIACFWDTQTSGRTWSGGGTGKTTAQMQTAKTFLDAGWDFVGETANGMEDLWWILEGKDYPRLWWEAHP